MVDLQISNIQMEILFALRSNQHPICLEQILLQVKFQSIVIELSFKDMRFFKDVIYLFLERGEGSQCVSLPVFLASFFLSYLEATFREPT